MKKLVLALTALGLIAGAGSPALAAPCKDKAGKFVKCPPPLAAKCRDAKGHFVKCPAKPRVCRNAKGHYTPCK